MSKERLAWSQERCLKLSVDAVRVIITLSMSIMANKICHIYHIAFDTAARKAYLTCKLDDVRLKASDSEA